MARTATVDYLKPARLDDRLDIVTRVDSLGRAQLVFAQNVERAGELLVTAKMRIACVDRRGKPCAMPKPLHDAFADLI